MHILPVLNLQSNTYFFSFLSLLLPGLKPIWFLCQPRDILEASGKAVRGRDRPAREGAPGQGLGGMIEALLPMQQCSLINWQENGALLGILGPGKPVNHELAKPVRVKRAGCVFMGHRLVKLVPHDSISQQHCKAPGRALFSGQALSHRPFKVKALPLHSAGSIQQGARGDQG